MVSISNENNILHFKGSNFLQQRLILSTLSGKPIRITEIRNLDDEPGLREYEINLIRLIDKVTNGTTVELNETGTSLYFSPGLLHGGKIEHKCNTARSLGYYLYTLMCFGPFCKVPIEATLCGVTNNSDDPSVDQIKNSGISTLKRFLVVDDGLEFKIISRGMPPNGGGSVYFKCPVRKNIRPIQLSDYGLVKRVRGTSFALRVSPAMANRMIDTAKGAILNFIPDVYISSDQCKGKNAGLSPGYGIHLFAETTTGIFYCAEQVSNVISEGTEASIPEDLGKKCALKLLQEIYRGGCVDSSFQTLVALFMALGQKDVSKFVIGPLTDYTIWFLRHMREFFGVTFKLDNLEFEDDSEEIVGEDKVVLTCVGVGYSNLNKRQL